MTDPGGLDAQAAARIARQFGVAFEQVRRDHLISLTLAALKPLRSQLVFFGGTALARSYLPQGRMSEDIDLIAVGPRGDVADALVRAVNRGLRATHGTVQWSRPLTEVRGVDPVTVSTDDAISVRIQLLGPVGYPPWPTAPTQVFQRYDDAPPVTLIMPTRAAFAAWKTVAWTDRHAARDLWDLWALAGVGAIDAEAGRLFAEHGPTLAPPKSWMFTTAPTAEQWREQLASQTILTVTPEQALTAVRAAWDATAGHQD
jgi:predicted nucleotidyltransferase component of viral defense system